ncbi:MAG: PrsW family glutamic-type intramembrane protease [Chloroflexota bacterium]
MNVAIALFISLLIPLGFSYLIHKRDFYGTGKFHYNITAIAAGMFVSLVAGLIQSGIVESGWLNRTQVAREVAPILEELLKAFILVFLVRRADFNYVVDGAIYGIGAGLGFAVVETAFYVMGTDGSAINLARDRVFSANLIHAAASGLVGSALAASQLERGFKRTVFAVFGLTLAIFLHMGFNLMVTAGTSVVLAILAGCISFGCVALIVELSLKVQGKWIAESLGMTDQVTTGEAAVVQRIQNMDEVLAPINQQFGPDKAVQTESLIYLQAEIGIKRGLVQQTADPVKRSTLQTELNRLTTEMNALRKAIGPYCLLFVRSIYLARGSQLWDVINARIRAAGQGPAGGGVWSTLDQRIKSSKARVVDRER